MSQKSSQLNPQAKPFTPRASPSPSTAAAAPQTPPRSATAAKKQDQATPMTKAARAAMSAATPVTQTTTWTHRGRQGQKQAQQWNVDTITKLTKLKDAVQQHAKQPPPLFQAVAAQGGQRGGASLRIAAPATHPKPQQQHFGTPRQQQQQDT
ncbi:hypothetical protein EBZ80_18020 [bacterium]|nr:hypothetical protein [bacterium]